MEIIALIIITLISAGAEAADEVTSPWTNESQVAVVQSSGNSVSESYSAKQALGYTQKTHTYKFNASYLNTSAENSTTLEKEETANKWDAGLRYEKAFSPIWSGFLAHFVESDEFAGFDYRYNTDLGGKYIIVKNEQFDAITEAGYRYVHQENIDRSQNHYNSARLYLEGNYKLNETNSAKIWLEYIPNFDDSKDELINTEASLSSTLSTVFSLKLAYLVKRDGLPEAGKDKIDRTLTTALVAKF